MFILSYIMHGWEKMENIPLSLLCVFQSYKIINFAPTLLQIIVSEQVEFPVRQAGETLNSPSNNTVSHCSLF